MDMPNINLGQYPKRTFEDLRLQTHASLSECSPTYFCVYPSHPGVVIRQLHHLISGFARFAKKAGFIRCLVWGRAGDIVHVNRVFEQFKKSLPFEVHGVISKEDDENWVRSQTESDVWCETRPDNYVQPPAPQKYFNCVLILGEHRRGCLEHAFDYVNENTSSLVVAVEDEANPYCSYFSGRFYAGGPTWRAG